GNSRSLITSIKSRATSALSGALPCRSAFFDATGGDSSGIVVRPRPGSESYKPDAPASEWLVPIQGWSLPECTSGRVGLVGDLLHRQANPWCVRNDLATHPASHSQSHAKTSPNPRLHGGIRGGKIQQSSNKPVGGPIHA